MGIDILINLGISALLVAIKKPEKRKEMRKIFLKVFQAIKFNFAGDPDFE